jgi:hypothetical protein
LSERRSDRTAREVQQAAVVEEEGVQEKQRERPPRNPTLPLSLLGWGRLTRRGTELRFRQDLYRARRVGSEKVLMERKSASGARREGEERESGENGPFEGEGWSRWGSRGGLGIRDTGIIPCAETVGAEGEQEVLSSRGWRERKGNSRDDKVGGHEREPLHPLRPAVADGCEEKRDDSEYKAEDREGNEAKDEPQLTLAMQRKTRSVSKGSKRKSRGCPIAQPRRTRRGTTKSATVQRKVG